MVLIPLPVLGFVMLPSIVQSPLSSLHARPLGLKGAAWFASCAQTQLIASSQPPFSLPDTIPRPKIAAPCSLQRWGEPAIR